MCKKIVREFCLFAIPCVVKLIATILSVYMILKNTKNGKILHAKICNYFNSSKAKKDTKNYCFMVLMATISMMIDTISIPLTMYPILALFSDSFVFIA